MNFITWSLPGKYAHLYDFSIRSFDCMVCRSFHTQSRYGFRSNVIRPLADEIAEPLSDMNIKVAAFAVSEKSINNITLRL